MSNPPRERVERLLRAARRLKDPADEAFAVTRERLTAQTGLSRAGVDLALELCLESDPSDAELDALCASVHSAPRSHVLLSANVFVAAHRAIALGLAASPEVVVRASRRDPELTRFLHRASGGAFELTSELSPGAGEQLFAFGHDATLREVARSLAPNVRLEAHGSGFGVAAVQAAWATDSAQLTAWCAGLARDVGLFDQRGCLSPRLVFVEGSGGAERVAECLAEAMAAFEIAVPLGALSDAERAEVARFRQTLTYAGALSDAGSGTVGVLPSSSPETLPPAGRHVVVRAVNDARAALASLQRSVTTFAALGSPDFTARLATELPHARRGEAGALQRPAFDGPVDRRPF